MKKTMALVLALVLCLSLTAPAWAEEEEIDSTACGDNLTWALDETTPGACVLTISGTGDMYDFNIDPAPWNDAKDKITAVVIQPGVTSIGYGAFSRFGSLTSVTIPSGIASVGDWALFGSRLTTVTIPEGVVSIGIGALGNCEALTSVSLPSSAASIASYAFFNCSSLADIYYGGTQEQWMTTAIAVDGNEALSRASIHFSDVPAAPGATEAPAAPGAETPAAPAADAAQIPWFPVTLGGQSMDPAAEEYPFLVRNGITYLPLTYYGCLLLGLDASWTQETGLVITDKGTPGEYQSSPLTGDNSGPLETTVADIRITLMGQEIDNQNVEYPFLLFRSITYLPMTWEYVHDLLGCDYAFDSETGLTISRRAT